jgi:hypothetical protein
MKHTILFLAANPADTDRLELDREAHDIHDELSGRESLEVRLDAHAGARR